MFDAPEVLCLGPTLFFGLSLSVVVLIDSCLMFLICVLIDLTLLMFLIDTCRFDLILLMFLIDRFRRAMDRFGRSHWLGTRQDVSFITNVIGGND